MMKRQNLWLALLLGILMANGAQAQIDPGGRQHAIALYNAYEAGYTSNDYRLFEQLFMGNPALTKRAFVSSVEYMTEIYETSPGDLEDALEFTFEVAQYIQTEFGDPMPMQLLTRMMNGDQRVPGDMMRYAAQLYPAYAQEIPQAPATQPAQYPSGFEAPAPNPNRGPFRPANAVGGPPKTKGDSNKKKTF